MSNDKQPLLEISDLQVKFGQSGNYFTAVEKLSLKVYEGEIIGLIGESGSGKTTSAQSVLGLTSGWPGIISGKAQFLGRNILPNTTDYVQHKDKKINKRKSYLREHRKLLKNILGKQVASIFQEPKSALNPFMSIGSHLKECMSQKGKHGLEAKKEGLNLLTKVGIVDSHEVWNLFPHQLSGGMAQRVMIAMALSSSPKLIIADEPTTALDVTTQAKLLDLFLRLKTQNNLSFIIISHDIGVIREITDRVYVMYQGNIVESGKTIDVIYEPKHDYTKHLLKSFYQLSDSNLTSI